MTIRCAQVAGGGFFPIGVEKAYGNGAEDGLGIAVTYICVNKRIAGLLIDLNIIERKVLGIMLLTLNRTAKGIVMRLFFSGGRGGDALRDKGLYGRRRLGSIFRVELRLGGQAAALEKDR